MQIAVAGKKPTKAARFRDVAYVLTRRSLDVRYRGSRLGVYWSLLNPLLMTAVYSAIFGSLFAKYYPGAIQEYVVQVFVGLTVVNFFVGSTQAALTSVVAHGPLVNKLRVPFEAFPVAAVAAFGVQLAVAILPFLVVLTLGFSRSIGHVLLLPIPLAALVLFSTGIGFVVAALYVHFRDIPYMYDLVAFLILIATPVFYPIAIAPAGIQAVLRLNPLFSILQSLRELVVDPVVDPQILLVSSVVGAGTCAFGWLVFRLMRPGFMDLL